MNRPPFSSSGTRRQSVNPFAAVLLNSEDDEIPPTENMSTSATLLPKESCDDDDDADSQTSNSSDSNKGRVRPPRPSMAVVAANRSIGGMNQRRRRRSSARFLHLTGGTSHGEKNSEEMVHDDDDRLTPETNSSLQEMYQTAIRMNAENKINTTNTWNLHIIDQMDTLLSLNEETEEESASEWSISATNETTAPKNSKLRVNFTKASCTLDASVKIYSFRVDDVHLTSYKVLANLNRTQNNKQEDSLRPTRNNQDPTIDDEGLNRKSPHPSKGPTGSTLEANMANINLNKLDSAFDIDPLFHKMSKTFDEGGAKGLLLANLGVSEASCHIVFDSSASDVDADSSKEQNDVKDLEGFDTPGTKARCRIPEGNMDVSVLISKLGSLLSEHRADDDWDLDSNASSFNDLRNVPLVPQLSALRVEHEKLVAAGCCGPDAAIALASTIGPKTPAGKVRQYHPDSQQEQDADFSIHQEAIERSQRKNNLDSGMKFSPATALFRNRWSNDGSNHEDESPGINFSMDEFGSGGFIHDDGIDDDNDDHCFDTFIANARYSDISLAKPTEANSSITCHQSSAVADFIDNIAAGITVLSENDYEFITASNLPKVGNSNIWAGASHWKRNFSSKPKSTTETVLKKGKRSKSRKVAKAKDEQLVDFSSNSAPNLSFLWKDSTKRKGSTATTQLSKSMISKYTKEENILPIDLGFQNSGGFDCLQQLTTLFLRPNISVLQSLSSSQNNIMPSEGTTEMKKTVEFQLPSSVDHFSGNDDEDNGGPGFDFSADDDDDEYLVPELENIRRVHKLRVGYATVAKKVDVKRLKRDLWQELESRFGILPTTNNVNIIEDTQDMEEPDVTRGANTNMAVVPDVSENKRVSETVISFHDAVRTLGEQQPQGDITLPFYFICILHLANEKGLRLEQGDYLFSEDNDRIEHHRSLLSDFFIHQN